MIASITTFLIFWLLVLSGDALIGTLMFRVVAKKWWWQKDIKQPWSFSISSDGWSFSAQDFNPLETFKRMFAHIMGSDKKADDILRELINRLLKEKAANANIDDETINEIIKAKVKRIVDEYMKEKGVANEK